MHPEVPEFKNPENPSREEWRELALAWYAVYYTHHEKTEAEIARLYAQKRWLKANVPEDYREGVHLLACQAAFMGEDIYVADGTVQHTLHVYCKACGKPEVVWRKQGQDEEVEMRVWCVPCGNYTETASSRPVALPADKAENAAALPGFRWSLGMRALPLKGMVSTPVRLTDEHEWPHDLGLRVPDLTDPPTGGCLLTLLSGTAHYVEHTGDGNANLPWGAWWDGQRTDFAHLGEACFHLARMQGEWA